LAQIKRAAEIQTWSGTGILLAALAAPAATLFASSKTSGKVFGKYPDSAPDSSGARAWPNSKNPFL